MVTTDRAARPKPSRRLRAWIDSFPAVYFRTGQKMVMIDGKDCAVGIQEADIVT
jgi:hypothetical protein